MLPIAFTLKIMSVERKRAPFSGCEPRITFNVKQKHYLIMDCPEQIVIHALTLTAKQRKPRHFCCQSWCWIKKARKKRSADRPQTRWWTPAGQPGRARIAGWTRRAPSSRVEPCSPCTGRIWSGWPCSSQTQTGCCSCSLANTWGKAESERGWDLSWSHGHRTVQRQTLVLTHLLRSPRTGRTWRRRRSVGCSLRWWRWQRHWWWLRARRCLPRFRARYLLGGQTMSASVEEWLRFCDGQELKVGWFYIVLFSRFYIVLFWMSTFTTSTPCLIIATPFFEKKTKKKQHNVNQRATTVTGWQVHA